MGLGAGLLTGLGQAASVTGAQMVRDARARAEEARRANYERFLQKKYNDEPSQYFDKDRGVRLSRSEISALKEKGELPENIVGYDKWKIEQSKRPELPPSQVRVAEWYATAPEDKRNAFDQLYGKKPAEKGLDRAELLDKFQNLYAERVKALTQNYRKELTPEMDQNAREFAQQQLVMMYPELAPPEQEREKIVLVSDGAVMEAARRIIDSGDIEGGLAAAKAQLDPDSYIKVQRAVMRQKEQPKKKDTGGLLKKAFPLADDMKRKMTGDRSRMFNQPLKSDRYKYEPLMDEFGDFD